jgi:hypothetical protein
MKNSLSKAHPSSLMNNGSERQKGASLPLLTARYFSMAKRTNSMIRDVQLDSDPFTKRV